jgi:dephospho-CoA kinase
MWIGLTGGIASGKSQVSKILRAKGYPVIDADEISRNLSKKDTAGYLQIVSEFGQDLLDSNQDIDRVRLGQLVFSDKTKLVKLENILHPLVRQEVEKQKQEYLSQGKSVVFYDVPLLFEKNMQNDFDWIVLVATHPENQIQRLCRRNCLSQAEAQLRIQAQRPMSEKIKLANWIIENNSTLEDLNEQVEKCLQALKKAY